MRTRQLKTKLHDLLTGPDLPSALAQIHTLPARRVVNPLFSFFHSMDERLKWHAVTAMGDVVARLAGKEPESARVIMRRLMWSLNDESGGIGWGSPEAMGDIMARHGGMADEYACILVSYVNPAGNYLEHETLQRGVLWGLGRLAHARPEHAMDSVPHLPAYMRSPDPALRGLALWAAAPLKNNRLKQHMRPLIDDKANLTLYRNFALENLTVKELAEDAMRGMDG